MKTSEIKALGFKRVKGMGWVLDCPFQNMPAQQGGALPPPILLYKQPANILLILDGCTPEGAIYLAIRVLKANYPQMADIIRRMYDAWKAVTS